MILKPERKKEKPIDVHKFNNHQECPILMPDENSVWLFGVDNEPKTQRTNS